MTHKRMMIIGAILLIVGTISAYGIWQVERPGGLVWQDGFKYKRLGKISQYEYSNQLPSDYSEIKNLSVTAEHYDVSIIKGTKFSITETKYGKKASDKSLSVSYKEGGVSIEENRNHESLVFFGINNFIHKIIIEIPEETQLATIEAKTKHGDLKIKNVKHVDKLSVSSDNGDVIFENIVTKYARISNENGDLNIRYANFDSLCAKNENGDITLKKSSILNDGDISNQNGDIELDKTKIPDFYAHTLDGDREIKRSQVANEISKETAKLRILNQNGDIEID